MGGKDLGKKRRACRSQDGEETAPVAGRHLPANQALFFESVNDAGQGSLGDQGLLGQLAEGHSLGVAQGGDDVKLRWCEAQTPDVSGGVGGKGMIGLGKFPQDGEKRFLFRALLQIRRGLYCRLPKYFLTHLFPHLSAGKLSCIELFGTDVKGAIGEYSVSAEAVVTTMRVPTYVLLVKFVRCLTFLGGQDC